MAAAVGVVAWPGNPEGLCQDLEEEAAWFRSVMSDISDECMPRAGPVLPRRSVYWWSPEIAGLRTECNTARRQYADTRRRQGGGPNTRETDGLGEGYRSKRTLLAKNIEGAKADAWAGFLRELNRDPWGRPYKMVRKKLCTWAPPLTETLDPRFIEGVVNTLFPTIEEEVTRPPERADPVQWSAEMGVKKEELGDAMERLGLRDTASGPDGIHGRMWTLAQTGLGDRLRRFYNACVSQGRFPSLWKDAKLVLLQKEGRPADQPSAYRPICLLDEAGKLFERVIAVRLVEHLSRRGPDLAECQFGFREGRSTVDAINHVRSLSKGVVARGGVVLAISLDIANGFNTLPWERIREALIYHEVPLYLRRIIGDYLRDRWVVYPGRNGTLHRRRVYCGVPQGSVLGPVLWNLGYDSVLRAILPPGVSVVCYADDTLLIATGADWNRAHARAEVGARHIVSRIRALGLRVDLGKTEALWFHAPRRQPPLTQVRVGEANIRIGTQMKYLGLSLDGSWCFRGHFDRLAPRVKGVALAMGRLLPNIGGPKSEVRHLYVGVVRSMDLYGAPVWARGLYASPQNRNVLLQTGRRIAQRVTRTYRTVSAVVAHVLAGVPPFDLLAEMYDETYHRTKEIRRGAGTPEGKDAAVEGMKPQAWRSVLRKWHQRLAVSDGQEIVRAIRPHFHQWLDSSRGLTFYMAQVLTGHGCFGEYLCRIGRELTTQCRWCGAARDTAAHTLGECSSFEGPRCVLRAKIGGDLSLPAIVSSIVGSEERWQAFASFCKDVMLQKEAKERESEWDPNDPTHGPPRPRRRGKRGPGPRSSDSSSSSEDGGGGGSGGSGSDDRGVAGANVPAAAPVRRAIRRARRGAPSSTPGGSDAAG